jgi:hypothetical protein
MNLGFLNYESRRLNEDHAIYTLLNSRNRGIVTDDSHERTPTLADFQLIALSGQL